MGLKSRPKAATSAALPMCPWCGDEALPDVDPERFDERGLHMSTCYRCGKRIRILRVETVMYEVFPVE